MADTSGPSPWIVDVLQLNLDNLDVSQLPALSCSKANEARLQGSLSVSNDLTVENTVTVTKNLNANGGLSVTGLLSVSNGAVGIGTTTVSPGVQLHVVGTAKASEFLTTLYTAGTGKLFPLSSVNTWADITDLTQTFVLAQETAVLVYYQISTLATSATAGSKHLVTRLVVDGKDQVFGRSIVGATDYVSPSNLWIGRLAKGSHTVKVQYRTPATAKNDPSSDDWENRVLHILVFGS